MDRTDVSEHNLDITIQELKVDDETATTTTTQSVSYLHTVTLSS